MVNGQGEAPSIDPAVLAAARVVAAEVRQEIDPLIKKIDGYFATAAKMEQRQNVLESRHRDLAGKTNDLIDSTTILSRELRELWYEGQTKELFKLRKAVMIFGPAKPKEGKLLLNRDNFATFLKQAIPEQSVFRTFQFRGIKDGMVRVTSGDPDKELARRNAAKILLLKESIAEKFEAYPKHDEPQPLRELRKEIRAKLRWLASEHESQVKIAIFRGLAFYDNFPICPEYLWPVVAHGKKFVSGQKFLIALRAKITTLKNMRLDRDFSEEQLSRGVFYELALEHTALLRHVPSKSEDDFEFLDTEMSGV